MVCPWPFLASLDYAVTPAKSPTAGKSFAQVLSGLKDFKLTQLPPKVVMGKTVRVKITQTKYESGLVDCSSNIHGRLKLRKGNSPLSIMAL